MDATPGSKKAPPPAADADAVPSAAQQSSSLPESAVAVSVRASSGGGEDDDEQVERFYALLDNIRAMRGMVSAGAGTAAVGRKRARDAEPPWRPAFRMEDFELEEEVDSDSAGCAGEKKKKKRESGAKRPADDNEEQEEAGEVVEDEGRRREQPQSHKARRSGVLAVDT